MVASDSEGVDRNGTRRRVGRLATVVAALGFVALVAVTLVVALFT